MGPLHIMLVEDHQVVREGLRRILELEPDMQVVAEASNGEDALAQVSSVAPDIVLMDIKMPGMDGIEAIRRLKQLNPNIKVMVVTFYDTYFAEAIQAGASGYVLKDVNREALVNAIREVQEGRFPVHVSFDQKYAAEAAALAPQRFSDRELEVLRRVANGMSSRDISGQLFLSEATIKRTVRHLFEKLGSHNRAEAVAEAMRRNLI